MPRQKLLNILLTVAALLVVLALATLIPTSTGSRSDLGYLTWCPFAPWSTLLLLAGAGLVWVIRGYSKTQAR